MRVIAAGTWGPVVPLMLVAMFVLAGCRSEADVILGEAASQCKKAAPASVCKCYVRGVLNHYGERGILRMGAGMIPADFVDATTAIRDRCAGGAPSPIAGAPPVADVAVPTAPAQEGRQPEPVPAPAPMTEAPMAQQSPHPALQPGDVLESQPRDPASRLGEREPTPSFSCSRAATRAEHLICSDYGLAELDNTLAAAFADAAACTHDRTGLRDQQRNWIASSRDPCSDIACVAAVYSERIQALRQACGIADASPVSAGVPVCAAGDGRISVPVWAPSVDAAGNLDSEPPQHDGQIVFIRVHREASDVACDNTSLNSFSWPNNPRNVMDGGLAVNIRGNVQSANGICYFRGYYMNEQVMGMHQGWTETYFGALETADVVMSGRYCLSRPPG